jgi:hypothetical protein
VPANPARPSLEALCQAYAALWAALHLGGVGQRSRRGSGSLRARSVAGLDGLELPGPVLASEPGDYARALQQGLRQVRRALGSERVRPIGAEGEFPILGPSSARLRVARPAWGGPEERVRERLMKLRRDHHRAPSGRGEYEFGEISPRLSSPLWIRVAAFDQTSALVVVTLMRHRGASSGGRRPDWGNAHRFLEHEGLANGVDVDLDGEAR